jgi:hypothetical protein
MYFLGVCTNGVSEGEYGGCILYSYVKIKE